MHDLSVKGLQALLSGSKNYICKWLEILTPELADNFYNTITKCYWMIYDLKTLPKCIVCGKPIAEKRNTKLFELYPKTCSLKCKYADETLWNNVKTTKLKKYGSVCPLRNNNLKKISFSKYLFNNICFDSAPELAFYIWLSDNNIKFEYQPNITFEYEFEGKKHFYMPDFLVENQLIEIKGRQFLNEDGTWRNPYNKNQNEICEAKHQCVLKNNVKILYFNNYKKYLDYINDKYGKDYLKKFKNN